MRRWWVKGKARLLLVSVSCPHKQGAPFRRGLHTKLGHLTPHHSPHGARKQGRLLSLTDEEAKAQRSEVT